ncbi:MAG: hypothetical protein ACK5DE_09845 [Bacteroidota bacterium]|jgi:predicted phosphodiesterase
MSKKKNKTLALIEKYTVDGELTVSKTDIARELVTMSIYDTIGDARFAVRYYTGSTGKRSVKAAQSTGRKIEKSTVKQGLKKALFNSWAQKKKPVHVSPGKWLVMQDIHIPYQINETISAAIEYAKEINITGIVLNGDIMDCYDLSRWDKESKRPKIMEELQLVRRFLDFLVETFPGKKIYYKFGNHEERYHHYMLKNAKELSEVPEISLEALLNLKELGIEKVGREIIKMGKFNLLHGHEFQQSVNQQVNPARGLYTKIKTSGGIGHHHQISSHAETTLDGSQHIAHSFGCMCDMEPEYMPYAYLKWRQGFGIIEVFKDDSFIVHNKEVIGNKVI